MNKFFAFLVPFLEEWPLITAVVIVTAIAFYIFYLFLKKDMQTLSKEIGYIDKILSNHVTDTNKKIDKLDGKIELVQTQLEGNVRELKTELKEDVRELKGGQAKLEGKIEGNVRELKTELKGDVRELKTELKGDVQDLKGGQAKLEGKIDKLLEK